MIQGKTLGQCFRGRENNLGLLRFIAALMVILNHSCRLAENKSDFLTTVTGAQTTLGQIAVWLFFFYGGFLIMGSAMNKKTAKAYFRARCLRILPPLWIVVLLSVFILGPVMTKLSAGAYFASGTTWTYLRNFVLVPSFLLPGVFEGHFNTAVNGSLWTLPLEFICYILCFVFYKLGLAEGKKPLLMLLPVTAGAIAGWVILSSNPALRDMVLPVFFFYLGMVCFLQRDRIPMSGPAAAGALVLLVLAVIAGVFTVAACVLLPYILLYLAFGTKYKAAGFGRKLELSYAIYLTGFPIQQILIDLFPQMSAAVNFLLAACLSVCVSIPITLADRYFSQRMDAREKRREK